MKAKRNILFTTVVLITLISSCTVLSFYPLYTEDVLVKNDKIIGKWETTIYGSPSNYKNNDTLTLVWEITFDKKLWKESILIGKKGANKYTYSLFLYRKSTPNKKSEFHLHLINLAGETFIDFYPVKYEFDNDIIAFHLIGVHTFSKVDIKTDSITVNWFDSDWFERKLKEEKIRIKHEKNSSNILLTAQPKKLQEFVVKYADDENAFDYDSPIVLKPQQ